MHNFNRSHIIVHILLNMHKSAAILRLVVFLPISLLTLTPFVSCEDTHRQQKQKDPTPTTLRRPIYFSKLSQSRIDREEKYAEANGRWSQRVILEMFHSAIIGKSIEESEVRKYEASGSSSLIGTLIHHESGTKEHYRKEGVLDWKKKEYEGHVSICNNWEGVTCHKRNDNGLNDTCWCISDNEEKEYQWSSDSISTNKACIAKCDAHNMVGKNQAPLDAVTRINFKDYGIVSIMFPEEFSGLRFLEGIELANNRFIGKIPRLKGLRGLRHLDLSSNHLQGFPSKMVKSLHKLNLKDTGLNGTIPTAMFALTKLKALDISSNKFSGTVPSEIGLLTNLVHLSLSENYFTGKIPSVIGHLKSLQLLSIGSNYISGTIPTEILSIATLESMMLNNNNIEGTIPSTMFPKSLKALDISHNNMSGSITKEMQVSTDLTLLKIHGNRIKGRIDKDACERFRPTSKYQKKHMPQCTDLIACPRGYFNELGYATETKNCAPCPSCHSGDLKDKTCAYLGQTSCNNSTSIVRGDMNGDGELSVIEFLRLLYVLNDGYAWGKQYSSWGDINGSDPCDLKGIDCRAGRVITIDLKGVGICSKDKESCGNLPSEIGLLHNSLEVLDLGNKHNDKFKMLIPTEIGSLTALKVLDLSNISISKLPSELALCQQLIYLNLFSSDLTGVLGDSVLNLKALQKLDIRENKFSPQDIRQIVRLENLQELLGSRARFVGSLPSEIGKLTNFVNLELWGNALVGSIPKSFENLKQLTRIDLYNNQLTGSIEPLATLPALEILHLKHNRLYGGIPPNLGSTALRLSWLDLTNNMFFGEIPSNLGSLQHLVNIQLGGNKLYPPIPDSLCRSTTFNGGKVGDSCDHIVCPMGTVSEHGFAKPGMSKCIACKEGESTAFLGQTTCSTPSPGDHIELFLGALHGLNWMPTADDRILFRGVDPCEWPGVVCNKEQKTVESIEFSLSNVEFNENLFTSTHI